VAAGDKIEVADKAKAQPRIKTAVAMASQVGFPEWVEVDDTALVGTLKNLPARDDILPDVNENLVIELYSK
jgi:small subunit ribosomal protein S4